METKICGKCNKEKLIKEFYLSKGKPKKLCKLCIGEQMKEYRENNKESLKKYHETYQIENKEKLATYRKEFYSKYNKGGEHESRRNESIEKTRDSRLVRQKEYRENNKEKIKEILKIYGKNNRKKLNEYSVQYYKKNRHIKIWYSTLRNTLTRLNITKEGRTIDLLGYSAIELKEHITTLFTDGMSWDNYGEWHIDHIKPVSEFNSSTPMDVVNALSNLQPLWATTREINGIVYIGNLNKNRY